MRKFTILSRAFLIALCTTLLASCSSLKGGFTITGEVEKTNHVYLVSTLPDAPDTLASRPVKNGKFTITGKVEQPFIARLLFRDKQEEKTLFLENNTTYTLKDGRVEAPGETQKLIDQFDEIYQPLLALAKNVMEAKKSGDQSALLALIFSRINEIKTSGERLNELLQANANTEIAAYYVYAQALLQEDQENKDLRNLKPMYDLLGEKAKSSIYGKALQPQMDVLPATIVTVAAVNVDNDPRMVDYARERQPLVDARKDVFYNVYVPYLNPKAGEKKGPVSEGIGIVTRIDKADADIKAFTKQYVEQHRDEVTAALALSGSLGYSIGYFTVNEIDALISLLSPAVKATTEGKNLLALVDFVKRSAVGAKFTDFTLNDPEGNPVRLADHVGKGKYVLLEFWASWCGPCRKDIPHLKEVYELYHSSGFEIISISMDAQKEAWLKAVEAEQMPWLQASNLEALDGNLNKVYNFAAIPACVLVGPDGTIIDRNMRGSWMDRKLIELYGNKFGDKY